MSIAASYSPSDLPLFTPVLDQMAAEAGILAVPDLVAFARAGI